MVQEKTNTLTIKTPEGIDFSLLLAGPVTRFLAWAIDLASIAAAWGVVSSLLGILGVLSRDFALGASILAYFLISVGYGITMEWHWRGQTLGKRLFRLRVMDVQGLRLQLSQIVIRNLLRFVDSLPAFYFVGGLTSLVSRRAQRLGDIAANTIVVRNPLIAQPDLDQLLEDKYNSFRSYPHLEARLRQSASPEEASVALQSLLRRNELEPMARIGLFRDIASHFSALVEFPPEAVEGLSDEQYVRNVVDAIYRSPEQGR